PGIGRTSASWRAYRTPNGVICGGAVDGSNQLGAMVMGQAITASPVGDGWPVTSRAAASVSITSTRSSTTRLASTFVTVLAICFSPLWGDERSVYCSENDMSMGDALMPRVRA